MQKEYTYYKDLYRMLFLITFACIVPLIIIFITYTSNPNFYLIPIIFDNTQNIPSVISSYNPVMTKVMCIYGKSAPLLAFIAFIMLFKHTRTHKITDRKKIITASILSPFLCIFYAYFFLWHNFELTTSG
ncbi:colicin immunity protein Cui, partial [Enterococcus faecium]|uniref:colicin immunity protein Cui n=1 Tax=Enterococcus faecium TaxID=1352 RepID=UPI0039A5A637